MENEYASSRVDAAFTMQAYGVDTRNYRVVIDWAKIEKEGRADLVDTLRSGYPIRFAVLRATVGNVEHGAMFDPPVPGLFRNNWAALQRTSLIRGAYHLFRPCRIARAAPEQITEHANAQMTHYLRTVGSFGIGVLPPILDLELEDQTSETKSWVKANAATYVQGALRCVASLRGLGRAPIICTGSSFWSEYLGNPTGFEECPLWLVDYRDTPVLPKGWGKWTILQFRQNGIVCSNCVELNVFNGGYSAIRRIAGLDPSYNSG